MKSPQHQGSSQSRDGLLPSLGQTIVPYQLAPSRPQIKPIVPITARYQLATNSPLLHLFPKTSQGRQLTLQIGNGSRTPIRSNENVFNLQRSEARAIIPGRCCQK
ncbi:hypothetical protein BaRGS_00016348 [Batillaria attramentaria]|uniref:Uncharacterized protein n=1 Tax=Batillaria attramentaria TaxID=370345 RepID=A0ABD0L036_9CAEN